MKLPRLNEVTEKEFKKMLKFSRKDIRPNDFALRARLQGVPGYDSYPKLIESFFDRRFAEQVQIKHDGAWINISKKNMKEVMPTFSPDQNDIVQIKFKTNTYRDSKPIPSDKSTTGTFMLHEKKLILNYLEIPGSQIDLFFRRSQNRNYQMVHGLWMPPEYKSTPSSE